MVDNSVIDTGSSGNERIIQLHAAVDRYWEQAQRRQLREDHNRPIAGATHDKALSVGKHPLQLYSLGTLNGVKVTILLEELLALGHSGAEDHAWLINIGAGDQFGSGFVGIISNSKIPALLDRSGPRPIRVFESGDLFDLSYLAEKFGGFSQGLIRGAHGDV